MEENKKLKELSLKDKKASRIRRGIQNCKSFVTSPKVIRTGANFLIICTFFYFTNKVIADPIGKASKLPLSREEYSNLINGTVHRGYNKAPTLLIPPSHIKKHVDYIYPMPNMPDSSPASLAVLLIPAFVGVSCYAIANAIDYIFGEK